MYRAEHTDSLTGFLTRDTYAGDQTEPVSLNRYTYAGNNPVNLEAPSGHGWLKKKVQQAVKKTASKAKKVVKSAAKKVTKAVTKAAQRW